MICKRANFDGTFYIMTYSTKLITARKKEKLKKQTSENVVILKVALVKLGRTGRPRGYSINKLYNFTSSWIQEPHSLILSFRTSQS